MSSHVDHLHNPLKTLNNYSLYFAGDIAIIVMNDVENRLNLKSVNAIHSLLDEIERTTTCKGVITTGIGKFYGNGLDIDYMSKTSPDELQEYLKKLVNLFYRVLMFPLPTVAAINGHAFAGGALLAVAHDLRVQKPGQGFLCFNEVFIKRRFAPFNIMFLSKKLGIHNHDAIVMGKRFTAEEAFSKGIVHACVPESLLISESINILKSFMGKTGYPRDGLRQIKEDVYADVVKEFELNMERLNAGQPSQPKSNL